MAEDIVGTNAEGTAVEEGFGVQVWGPEHFVLGMQGFCCTAVPIRDPLRRSIRALLGVSLPLSAVTGVDPRSVALIAEGAAAEITRLLMERLALREQALLSTYLTEVRKRGRDCVLVMDHRTTIASTSATRLLEQRDYAVLAGYAKESERLLRPVECDVRIGQDSTFHIHARPVLDGGQPIGSVIRLRSPMPAKDVGRCKPSTYRGGPFEAIVGESIPLRRALELGGGVVSGRMQACIVGERGTGRTALAKAMAAQLAREVQTFECAQPGISNDATIPLAMAALGRGSAVVLRHVDALSASSRSQLAERLTGIESPPVMLTLSDPRDGALLQLTKELDVVEIEMPPLRDRRDDIPLLVSHFLSRMGSSVRVSSALLRALTQAEWSGNVGQLKDLIETAAKRCRAGELNMEHLSGEQRRAIRHNPLSRLEEAELQQIREALAEAAGNRVHAAELLQIARSTLYRKIDMYTRRGFSLAY